MKIMIRAFLAIILLGAGAAVGFPIGESSGFSRGSEWAMVQADISAREAGAFMPVRFQENQFHVVLKQPKGLYTLTRRLADQQEGARRPHRFPEVQQDGAGQQQRAPEIQQDGAGLTQGAPEKQIEFRELAFLKQ